MLTRLIHHEHELVDLTPAWRELMMSAARPQIVLDPTWVLPWWRIFGAPDGRTLCSVAVHQGSRLVGLALLSKRLVGHRGVVPIRRIETLLTGENTSDEICSEYVGLLAAPGLEDAVGHVVGDALARGDAGGFDELRCVRAGGDDRALGALFARLASWGHPVEEQARTTCPYVVLPTSWDDYLKTRKKAQRYSIRLSLSELEAWAAGRPIELVAATDRDSFARGWSIFRRLHGARWAPESPSGLFASERFSRFHAEVAPRLLDEGRLDLLWLTIGGDPVAALYNLRVGGRSEVYQSGRVVQGVPHRLSLGTAVHAYAIRRAIERGDTEYDFLGGATLYKRQFATEQRDLIDRRAWGASPRTEVVRSGVSAVESIVARVRPFFRRPSGTFTVAEGAPSSRNVPVAPPSSRGGLPEAPPSSMGGRSPSPPSSRGERMQAPPSPLGGRTQAPPPMSGEAPHPSFGGAPRDEDD